MSKIKTQENAASVDDFVAAIDDPARREDCRALVALFASATRQKPTMWGDRIIGYGKRHYTYANGKPGVLCKVGFAPRAKTFALYIADFPGRDALLGKLGKHKFSGGCLHIPTLAGLDLKVLKAIVSQGYRL